MPENDEILDEFDLAGMHVVLFKPLAANPNKQCSIAIWPTNDPESEVYFNLVGGDAEYFIERLTNALKTAGDLE